MQITKSNWRKYQRMHRMLQEQAKGEFADYFDSLPWDEDEALAMRLLEQMARELVQRYGIADASLSAALYDEVMAMQGASVAPAAVVEPTAAFVTQDVREAVSRATSRETAKSLASGAVSGHVKRAGVETMRSAAIRDKAMWAWVCIGDSCAFCRTLGSRGWQVASRSVLAGNHASHIHDNCDCQFMVKMPGESLEIEGYDPDALRKEYEDAGGKNSKDAINAMRRADYTPEKAAERNARRRELYEMSVGREREVSSGERYNDLWFSQFESEVATVTVRGQEVYRHVGTPNSSVFPDVLPDGLSYSEADLHHTHTTPISGTFSDVDIATTVDTRCASSGITHTLTGREYKVTRLPTATSESAEAFKSAFQAYYSEARLDAEYELWEERYAEHGIPLDSAGRRQALADVQPKIDAWLRENAGRYGYRYDS